MIQKNLKQLQADSNKRDLKLYKNMFAHMTRDTPVATKVSGVSFNLMPRCSLYIFGAMAKHFFPRAIEKLLIYLNVCFHLNAI